MHSRLQTALRHVKPFLLCPAELEKAQAGAFLPRLHCSHTFFKPAPVAFPLLPHVVSVRKRLLCSPAPCKENLCSRPHCGQGTQGSFPAPGPPWDTEMSWEVQGTLLRTSASIPIVLPQDGTSPPPALWLLCCRQRVPRDVWGRMLREGCSATFGGYQGERQLQQCRILP